MSSPPSVLIAGAGPSGLILALALVQNGIAVRIIDKEPKHRVGQRGAGIMPRTLEVYNFLGVLPDILKQATPILPMRLYELPGGVKPIKTWNMFEPREPTPAIPYPNALLLGQDKAEAILRTHLEKFSTHVELGTELRSFDQNSDNVVAHLVKVQDGHEISETATYNWLIGADGARGVVRKQLGLTFLGETHTEHHIVVGDIRLTGLDRDHWHTWGDSSFARINFRPSERKDDDLFNFVVAGDGVDSAKLAADREELVKFVESTLGRNDINFGEVVWVSDYKPNVRMVDRFGEGRVFVAGDAAHVHSPVGGQGMNSSVQDSFNLAWKLALVDKGLASATLLSTYTEERFPVIAEMLSLSTALLNKASTAKVGDVSSWQRKKEMNQLSVNYRWSSIVVDEKLNGEAGGEGGKVDSYGLSGDGQIRGGDRAPDAPGLVDVKTNEQTTFFQTFGPSYHTVLVFSKGSDQAAPIFDVLRRYPISALRSVLVFPELPTSTLSQDGAGLVLADKQGYAYQGYAVDGEGTVVIVRPDGVIGAIVRGIDSSEGVEKYLGRIFPAA